MFYVDNIPIREVKRTKFIGGDFPSKPMTLYAIWDASDWASNGGKYRVNHKYALNPIENVANCDISQNSKSFLLVIH